MFAAKEVATEATDRGGEIGFFPDARYPDGRHLVLEMQAPGDDELPGAAWISVGHFVRIYNKTPEAAGFLGDRGDECNIVPLMLHTLASPVRVA